jgi:GTP 3',8-cyclase
VCVLFYPHTNNVILLHTQRIVHDSCSRLPLRFEFIIQMAGMRGLTYWLKGNMYISLTNSLNSASRIALRGPSFVMPANSGFQMLESNFEPDADCVFNAVDGAFENGKISISSMDAEPITFAGYGEPLLRYAVIRDAAVMIKDKRHGVSLRVKTSGLVKCDECEDIISELKSAGIDKMSVSLLADTPKKYKEIMDPQGGMGFDEVCTFIIGCVENDVEVECTAVNRPDVNLSNVRGLALALGATDLKVHSFHP